jgi:hypothetical protein
MAATRWSTSARSCWVRRGEHLPWLRMLCVLDHDGCIFPADVFIVLRRQCGRPTRSCCLRIKAGDDDALQARSRPRAVLNAALSLGKYPIPWSGDSAVPKGKGGFQKSPETVATLSLQTMQGRLGGGIRLSREFEFIASWNPYFVYSLTATALSLQSTAAREDDSDETVTSKAVGNRLVPACIEVISRHTSTGMLSGARP